MLYTSFYKDKIYFSESIYLANNIQNPLTPFICYCWLITVFGREACLSSFSGNIFRDLL